MPKSKFRVAVLARRSGQRKDWHAVTMIVLRCLKEPGVRVLCAREIQKTLAESAKRLIEDRIGSLGIGHMFRIKHYRITHPRRRMLEC